MSSKILFVDNSSRCFYIFRMPVAKAFKQAGYEVYVMTPTPDEYSMKIKKEGIDHISYPLKSKFSPMEDMKLLLFLRKQYKKLQPNYVIHYTIKPNIYGSIAAGINKIPSLAVVPGTGSVFSKKNIISFITTMLYKIAFRFPQKIWVLNQEDKKAFIQKNILKENRIEILLGEGVDINYFFVQNAYKKKSPFVFLYMGRMLKEKGITYLAEASSILKKKTNEKFEVHLLGLVDGLAKDIISLEQIKEWEKGGVVKYLGSISDVRKEIGNSDCVVLPSYYGEGVPRSLMEASAMQRAIITTDNVGCRDVIEDGKTGFLCKVKDAEDLSDKMFQMMSLNETEIQQMGICGRKKIIAEFDNRIIIKKYMDFIIRQINDDYQN